MLSDLGVERQDRIGIVIANVPAFIVWYYACLRLGAIAVSISTRLSGEEVSFILSDCGAKVIVGPDALVDSMRGEVPDCVLCVVYVSDDASLVDGKPLSSYETIGAGAREDMEPDDPATILYTSGTTGFPKGATLSHGNVRATMHAFNHLCGMETDDRLLLSVPLFHCYGQNALLNSGLNVGATIVLQSRFDLDQSIQLILDHQVTMLFGVPTMFQLMLQRCEPDDLHSIRYCFSAAAKLPEAVSHGWLQKLGMPIYEGYGLTETAPFASYNHDLKFVPGSIGMPVDMVEMKVVDPDTGLECPVGMPGEIAIRGPNVMLGYWNRPQETAAAIRDGWFYSGDIGQVDQQGYFYIVDRLKDMIVVGALKVFPAEVERVLLQHPAVSETAVVGFEDEVLGEKVVAFVVRAPETELTAKELISYCKPHLGAYKVPRQVVFIEELPRNPAGKVLKTVLREMELPNIAIESDAVDQLPLTTSSDSNGTSDSSRRVEASLPAIGPLVERLRATHAASRERFLKMMLQDELRELTGRSEAVDVDRTIIDSDFDSLMIVEFRDRLQVQTGTQTELPATLVFDHPTISDLATHLLSLLGHGETETLQVTAPLAAVSSANRGAEAVDDETDGGRSRLDLQLENMSEQQAMEALLREVND